MHTSLYAIFNKNTQRINVVAPSYYFFTFLSNLYSTESERACQDASIIFSFTPIVPQLFEESDDSINILTFAAVFALLFTTV
jgi:hypothetical protein